MVNDQYRQQLLTGGNITLLPCLSGVDVLSQLNYWLIRTTKLFINGLFPPFRMSCFIARILLLSNL